jgi:hypothetical protein
LKLRYNSALKGVTGVSEGYSRRVRLKVELRLNSGYLKFYSKANQPKGDNMKLVTQIGNTGTKVTVEFTLDEECDIDWDELKVYLYEHPDVDITDLIGNEWSVEISEEIYANADKLVQEEQNDAIIEARITNNLFKE